MCVMQCNARRGEISHLSNRVLQRKRTRQIETRLPRSLTPTNVKQDSFSCGVVHILFPVINMLINAEACLNLCTKAYDR